MPRKGHVPQRHIAPDPVYRSELVARLINKVMRSGKKAKAQQIVYKAFEVAAGKSGKQPLELFEAALKNVMPTLEVKPRRVGGSTYQVPVEVRPERRLALGLRWIVTYANGRTERTAIERLSAELFDASNNAGGAVRRKEEIHRMAEANKPFAHFRW